MPVIPVIHSSPAARRAVQRGLPRRGVRVVACGGLPRVERVLSRELVDAIVVEPRRSHADAAMRLVDRFPGIPVYALSTFRPRDGHMLLALRRAGVRLLHGEIDDGVAGELIASGTASRKRKAALRDAPALLRLTEPLQLRAWDEVLLGVGQRSRAGEIARDMGLTREHLSREFAAGGAPNLKRVIDLARVLCATDLLANPGYDVRTVGRILRFASPSHLSASSRRIAGVRPLELPRIGLRQVLLRFLKGRTRSRL